MEFRDVCPKIVFGVFTLSLQKAPSGVRWWTLGPATACTILAVILVMLRWYTRLSLTRRVGLEDYFITVALVPLLDGTMVYTTIPWTVYSRQNKRLVLTSDVLYQILINITKDSITIQYAHIFSERPLRYSCVVALVALPSLLCWEDFWGIFLHRPTQRSLGTAYAAGINIMMYFIVWLQPLPVIRQLRLPTGLKIGLVATFTIGGFVCIINMFRLAFVYIAVINHDFASKSLVVKIRIGWWLIEANAGIMCAFMLGMKPLLVQVIRNLLKSTRLP
ncbi:hypothetical protein AOQ84DRAFT_339054 [Glonium stellatum]|uniref:Rhodopsin domain-containing protein n=1 Tax=Glonium stellatum TaxID=574774 RepID=A0A8E2F3C4_9PEZI|nr:hypothetical protein AOQ84DRAFT_339054 [Glonium stellatum]